MRYFFHWPERKTNKPSIVRFKKKSQKKEALVIYTQTAVKAYSQNTYNDANFLSHSMHWESIEMTRSLLHFGYNVDYADCTAALPKINWQKYDLVIDERGNLYDNCSQIRGKKIFYATGCDWHFHNVAEAARIKAFNERFGLNTVEERAVPPILSGMAADVVTYFGNDFQRQLFPAPQKAVSLNLSTAFLPPKATNIPVEKRRKNFIWMGSRGFIHKGLDIVIEAFLQQRNLNLHICTNLSAEPQFYAWFKNVTEGSKNIFYHGFLDVSANPFRSIIENCIAIPYLSCAEGGAGAVLQAMQFNCLPIVCESTALRGQEFGMLLPGKEREELLLQLMAALEKIQHMPENILSGMAAASGNYAMTNHSRKSYSDSFRRLLQQVNA